MPNVSHEGVFGAQVEAQERWDMCPAKFQSLYDANVHYGGKSDLRRATLLNEVINSRMAEVACDCPLGSQIRLLGGKKCRQGQELP